MQIQRFEDIIAWQKSKDLSLAVYKSVKNLKDYSFKDQLQHAVVSIMNNIAEGFERQGNKEFRKFLYISKGSCAEVRSMLYIVIELRYIADTDFKQLITKTQEVSKLLSGFIKILSCD